MSALGEKQQVWFSFTFTLKGGSIIFGFFEVFISSCIFLIYSNPNVHILTVCLLSVERCKPCSGLLQVLSSTKDACFASAVETLQQIRYGSTQQLWFLKWFFILHYILYYISSHFVSCLLQHNVHAVRQAAGDPAHLWGDHAGGPVAAEAGLPVVDGRPFPRLPLRGAACTVSTKKKDKRLSFF